MAALPRLNSTLRSSFQLKNDLVALERSINDDDLDRVAIFYYGIHILACQNQLTRHQPVPSEARIWRILAIQAKTIMFQSVKSSKVHKVLVKQSMNHSLLMKLLAKKIQ